ncbi:MAG: hypothetical protein ABSC23_14960 [Bryobacteraceae bacterium]|jgi:hypothetical protein
MAKRMKPNPKIIGHVRDVEGGLWDVRQIRDTKHGFDLLFGSPVPRLGSYRGGLPRLIATRPLIDFGDANRTKHDGVLYDLPAGRSTLKRVRHRLGFHRPPARLWAVRHAPGSGSSVAFLPAAAARSVRERQCYTVGCF